MSIEQSINIIYYYVEDIHETKGILYILYHYTSTWVIYLYLVIGLYNCVYLYELTTISYFQSVNLTVLTDNPDVTRCFQATILTWIPTLVLLATATPYTLQLRRLDPINHTATSKLNIAKVVSIDIHLDCTNVLTGDFSKISTNKMNPVEILWKYSFLEKWIIKSILVHVWCLSIRCIHYLIFRAFLVPTYNCNQPLLQIPGNFQTTVYICNL